MENFKLNNGVLIPSIGFGTWQTPDGEVAVNSVKCAIEAGYRHIDTAAIYGNEKSIGRAIDESGIKRQEIFITSKVWNNNRGYEKATKSFYKTIEDLRVDYLDLLLIHWPVSIKTENWKECNADTWKALEDLYKAEKIRAIGVSNFLPHHLSALIETAEIIPAINQIEYHPGQNEKETVTFCKANDIVVEAWGPLGTGRLVSNPILEEIAQKYNKSVAQICIKWCLQNKILPLPKSITPERIIDNLKVYDFEIAESDMSVINEMPYSGGSGLNPDTVEFDF